MSMHAEVRKDHQKHAERHVRRAKGGRIEDEADEAPDDKISRRARGGRHPDEKEDKSLIKKMVGKAKIKLKKGGEVHGDKSRERLDKRARGGRAPTHKPNVAVVVHAGGEDAAKQMGMQQGIKQGMKMGAMMGGHPPAAAPGAPPHPPMGPGVPGGPPPPGGMPGQAMGGPRPPMPNGPMPPGLRRGGEVVEKVKVKEHMRRRAGGRVHHAEGGEC